MINWKSVCQSKEKGGLGSRNLSIFNKALLEKWSWRFTVEDSSMWKSVVNMKYGTMKRGWFPPLPKGYHGVSLWKEISKEGMLLNQHYSVKLGDGIKARFWEDEWCGEALLCSSFPSLYDMVSSKGARVVDLWVNSGFEGG